MQKEKRILIRLTQLDEIMHVKMVSGVLGTSRYSMIFFLGKLKQGMAISSYPV